MGAAAAAAWLQTGAKPCIVAPALSAFTALQKCSKYSTTASALPTQIALPSTLAASSDPRNVSASAARAAAACCATPRSTPTISADCSAQTATSTLAPAGGIQKNHKP